MDITKLVTDFSQDIKNLKNVLENAAVYYGNLFAKMIKNEDIVSLLKNETYLKQITELNEKIDSNQMYISECVGSTSKLKLHQINKRMKNINSVCQISDDTIVTAKQCLERYQFVIHRVKMIEEYFEQRVNEYKEFFQSVYTDNSDIYTQNGECEKTTSGLSLVSHHA